MSTNTRDEKVLADFQARLGKTSLIEMPHDGYGAKIYAKCEWENPTGSVKDRVAYAMLCFVLRNISKEDRSNLHILEYSGGSLGSSLAILCRDLKIPLTLVLGAWTDASFVQHLRDLGANVILHGEGGFYGVMEHAIELKRQDPNKTFLYQHENNQNILTHQQGTGEEIAIELSGKKVSAWVASIGTGGTLIGVYKALRTKFGAEVQLHAVSPAELPYGSEIAPNAAKKYQGSGGFGLGRKQAFVSDKESDITKLWTVSYDEAIDVAASVYRQSGIKVGSSAAANYKIAKSVASSLDDKSIVVTVFPSRPTPSEWLEISQIIDGVDLAK